MEAFLNELISKKQHNQEEHDLPTVKNFGNHLDKFVKIESKKITKTNEFKIVIEKAQTSNQLDIKVNCRNKSLFDILSCISFKGTQYKEYKFFRTVFSTLDEGYFPKKVRFPVSFTFNAYFEVNIESKPSKIDLDLTK